jgi:hypothetical protein
VLLDRRRVSGGQVTQQVHVVVTFGRQGWLGSRAVACLDFFFVALFKSYFRNINASIFCFYF